MKVCTMKNCNGEKEDSPTGMEIFGRAVLFFYRKVRLMKQKIFRCGCTLYSELLNGCFG